MTEQDWISLREAASLIVNYGYQDEDDLRAATNKAYKIMNYAVNSQKKIHRVDVGSQSRLNRKEFLLWAADKWPALRNAVCVPAVAELNTPPLNLTGGKLRVDITPSDPQELQDLLKRCRDELDEAKTEIERLKPLEAEWKAQQKKMEERRKKASDAGKNGGRGNVR